MRRRRERKCGRQPALLRAAAALPGCRSVRAAWGDLNGGAVSRRADASAARRSNPLGLEARGGAETDDSFDESAGYLLQRNHIGDLEELLHVAYDGFEPLILRLPFKAKSSLREELTKVRGAATRRNPKRHSAHSICLLWCSAAWARAAVLASGVRASERRPG